MNDLSLDIHAGEFLVILGPSGSGKTTLLRCIAGLERPDAGEILVGDDCVYSSDRRVWMRPERRGISMVFQGYALWPHMTAFDNVAYPLRARHLDSKQIRRRVTEALELVGCGHLAGRHPGALSGGQQQRVALARAIVCETRVVLFDEPLSSVDARVREDLRRELVSIHREFGFTGVYITHDQTEAMVIGDRVTVLADGKIEQTATPRDLYHRPASTYVAEFTGASNQFRGTVSERTPDGVVVDSDLGDVRVAADSRELRVGEAVVLVVRPEHCVTANERPPVTHDNVWQCGVESALFLGHSTELSLRYGSTRVLAWNDAVDQSGTVWLAIEPRLIQVVRNPS